MLNVSTRKYGRAVRLPEGDLPKARGEQIVDGKDYISAARLVPVSHSEFLAWNWLVLLEMRQRGILVFTPADDQGDLSCPISDDDCFLLKSAGVKLSHWLEQNYLIGIGLVQKSKG